MSDANSFNQLFLEELEALDRFQFARDEDGVLQLGPEDPDVRRLVEAMAFFSARTRAAAADATQAAVLRIAGSTLDDLLTAMPAAAMVQAVPNDRLVERVMLEKGTALRFQFSNSARADGADASPLRFAPTAPPAQTAGFFSTLQPLLIRPINVTSSQIRGARRALQLEIQLTAAAPQRGASQLDFYVRRHADYRASLALHVALQHHCVGVLATFDTDPQEVPCSIQFGSRMPAEFRDQADSRHPFAQLRSFFHFPEQDLYVCVDVPACAPRGWQKLTLRFALDAEWPEDQSIAEGTFLLHVVPAINAWTDFAAPIVDDGSRAVVELRSASLAREAVELCSIRGVYQAERQMAPLLPLALSNTEDGYEIVRVDGAGPPRLRLSLPEALEQPRKILADGVWSQPSLWSSAPGPIQVTPQQKSLPGVSFQLLGSVRRPQTSPLIKDASACLDVLSLKMRAVLERQGVLSMLRILGAVGDSPYRTCLNQFDGLTVSDAPDPMLRSGGVKHVYHVSLRVPASADANAKALLVRFAEKIANLLDAWTQDTVEIVTTPSARLP